MTTPDQKQTAHTAGPWRTNGCYISSNYGEVGHAYYVSGMPEGMSEANARLIAAAPVMYDYIAASAAAGDAKALRILEAVRGNS